MAKENNKQQTNKKPFVKKEYKGNMAPSEELVSETLKQVEKHCDTNNNLFLVKNLLNLMSKGYSGKINAMLYTVKENGASTEVITKSDEVTEKLAKEFIGYSNTIGYASHPISQSVLNNVDMVELTQYLEKRTELLKSLKSFEKETIDFLINNKINDLPTKELRVKVQAARTQNNSKKQNQKTLKKEVKVEMTYENDSGVKTKDTSKVTENEIPEESTKTIEEWKTFAIEKNIDIAGLTLKSDIYKKITTHKET